jgi:hypothetical protein
VTSSGIEQAISDVQTAMEWLLAEVPDTDGVAVHIEDEVFQLLEERANPN